MVKLADNYRLCPSCQGQGSEWVAFDRKRLRELRQIAWPRWKGLNGLGCPMCGFVVLAQPIPELGPMAMDVAAIVVPKHGAFSAKDIEDHGLPLNFDSMVRDIRKRKLTGMDIRMVLNY